MSLRWVNVINNYTMSSWTNKSRARLPSKSIHANYYVEDDRFIYLHILRNTTLYPDSDITVIITKTADKNIATVETITRDGSFTPYILHINHIPFSIRNNPETIRLFMITDRKQVSSSAMCIPKMIVQTWNTSMIEGTDLSYPQRILRTIHSDYEYVLYDQEERDQFIKTHYADRIYRAYRKLKPGAYQADLWRYCYLYLHGGFYCDIKFVSRIPFHAMITPSTKLVLGKAMYHDGVNNGLMGCLPGEPLMKLAIDTCVERIENEYYGESSLDITGPQMLEYCFQTQYGISSTEYVANQHDAVLMVQYDDINQFNCILYGGILMAHTAFSTYYTHYRTSPYVVFWNNRDVYVNDT